MASSVGTSVHFAPSEPVAQREMPTETDISAPTSDVADPTPPSVETDLPSVSVVSSEPVAQRETQTQTIISAPLSTAPTPDGADPATPSVETDLPSVSVVSSEPVAQRETLTETDIPAPISSAPTVAPPISEVAETAPPSVETDLPLVSVVSSEPVAQREMLSQPDVSETTISASSSTAPMPEVADPAPPSVETDLPSVRVVSSEPVARREMLSQADVSETIISAPSSTVPTAEVAETAPPSVETDLPSVSVVSSEPVVQREMSSQPDVSETIISAPTQTDMSAPISSAPTVVPPISEVAETVPSSVETDVPSVRVAPSEPVAQRETLTQTDMSAPISSAPAVAPLTAEVAETAPPSVETDIPPSVRVVLSEPVAQREMWSQADGPETTISASSSTVPIPEVADPAPPSVKTDLPSVSVAPSEPVAQREMLSQPDVSATTISAPSRTVPTAEVAETAQPSVETDIPLASVVSSEPVAQREMQPPPPIGFPNDLPAASVTDDQRLSASEPPRAQNRETNVLVSSGEAVNNWAVTPEEQSHSLEAEAADDSAEPPMDVFEALFSAGMVARSVAETDADAAADGQSEAYAPVAEERFTGAYLPAEADDAGDTGTATFPTPSVDVYTALRAMGLVPAARGSESKQASIQRSPQPESSAYAAPAPPMQREPLVPAIQREINEVDAFNPYADEAEAEPDFDQADLEQLARDVYRVLKDRLRIESERGRRR